jgi:hypothetical protein
MSTRITALHGALISLLGDTLYTAEDGWKRLPNPYRPEDNSDPFLKQGWGLAFASGQNTNRQAGGYFTVDRGFVVILCREFLALEQDAVAKAAAELALFEDQYALINALEKDVTVDQSTMYARYVGDGGIEYVSSEKNRFLMLRTQMSVEYFEQLT